MEKSSPPWQSDKEFDLQSFVEGQGQNKNAGSLDKKNKEFQAVFGFTDADLAANRAGRFGEYQVGDLKRAARSGSWKEVGWKVFVFCWFALFLPVFFWLFFRVLSIFHDQDLCGEFKLTSAIFPVGFLLLIIAILSWGVVLYGRGIWSSLCKMFFLKTPRLEQVAGTIVPGDKTGDTSDDENRTCKIEINGRLFTVPKAAYRLIDPSMSYTVYTAAYGKDDDDTEIVAIEERLPLAYGKSPLEYENAKLQRIFTFTNSDIVANRGGRLSGIQTARLSRRIGAGVIPGIVFGATIAILLLISIEGLTRNLPLKAAATGGVFFSILLSFTHHARRQQRVLTTAKVAVASGPADTWITRQRFTGGRFVPASIYHTRVGDAEYTVKENVYFAFKKGKSYNVYYVPDLDGRPIVSAERVESSPVSGGKSPKEDEDEYAL
jgi:hypothetical protein